MGFSIGYDIGPLGGLLIVVLISVGLIVLTFLLTAAKRAKDEVVKEEGDHPDIIG